MAFQMSLSKEIELMNAEQQDAVIAAEQDANIDLNKLVWLCAGFFGNIIGVLVAYIYQPTPPLTRLYEKSDEYKMYYNDTYKSKLRSGQLTYALIGIAILVGVYVLLFAAILIMQFSMFNMFKRFP